METATRNIKPCLPFLYRVKSFEECFGEEVKYIIQPDGYTKDFQMIGQKLMKEIRTSLLNFKRKRLPKH